MPEKTLKLRQYNMRQKRSTLLGKILRKCWRLLGLEEIKEHMETQCKTKIGDIK